MPVSDPGGKAMNSSRIERTCRLLADRGCSHAVAVGDPHVVHLGGYSRYQGGLSAVVLSANGERTLVVPRYELSCAEEFASAEHIVGYGRDDLLDFNPLPSLVKACVNLIDDGGPCALASGATVRDAFRIASEHPWQEFDFDLERVRRVKDADEVLLIRHSFQLALIGQQAVRVRAQTGASEIELFTAAQSAVQEAAGEPVEFIASVAAGANSALICAPFHVAGETRVMPGDPVLCDIAIRNRGYWGDTTRTYGDDSKVAAARDALTQILDGAAAHFRAGTTVSSAHQRMARSIDQWLPGASFPHHGGHAIGVEVGENPQVIPGEKTVLESGMVFALEPGAYFAGRFGARVENTYVVDNDRSRLITE